MVSQHEINQMLQEEIEKSVQLGLCLFPIREKVGLIDGTGVYGRCLVINGNAEVRLSRYLLDADKAEVRSVITHEVLHAIKGSKGHDALWKVAVARFKEVYCYNSKEYKCVDYHLSEHPYGKARRELEHFKLSDGVNPVYKYKLYCPMCNQSWLYKKKAGAVSHPKDYMCSKCKCSLSSCAL